MSTFKWIGLVKAMLSKGSEALEITQMGWKFQVVYKKLEKGKNPLTPFLLSNVFSRIRENWKHDMWKYFID